MKKILMLAASAMLLVAVVPEQADAQGMRRGGGGRGTVMARGVRPGPAFRPGGGYAYRGGYGYRRGPGWGLPLAAGVLGAAALGAAAYPYYGAGYADPCLERQQVVDAYGYARWVTVRVC